MVASTSNLAYVYGPASGISVAVDPILDNAKLVHFLDDTDPRFDHQTSPWFFRFPPSDSAQGAAMALYAIQHGYKHAATVFTTDAGAQTSVNSVEATYPKNGGRLAISLNLAPDQPSYRTEVSRLLAAHPDALITEMVPQTTATFLSELLQLNGGKMLPIIADNRMAESDEISPMLHVLGSQRMAKSVVAVQTSSGNAGPGYVVFHRNLSAMPQPVPNRQQYASDPFTMWHYDAMTIAALAIQAAKSTDPAKWAPLVMQITNGVPGAVVVHTFAEGKNMLASGHKIHYVGASGPLLLDKYHSSFEPYAGFHYVPGAGTGNSAFVINPGPPITQAQLAAAVRH
jgi:branched-chain amino acid transport system substrate-binding protein